MIRYSPYETIRIKNLPRQHWYATFQFSSILEGLLSHQCRGESTLESSFGTHTIDMNTLLKSIEGFQSKASRSELSLESHFGTHTAERK